MPAKMDESTPGVKVLKIFRKLLLDSGRHYQADLAAEFTCSQQTIIRVMVDIESVTGIELETGLENRRRWYRLRSRSQPPVAAQAEDVRYLSLCRDMAADSLNPEALGRMDETIFTLAMRIAEQMGGSPDGKPGILFFSKGMVDYRPFLGIMETLARAMDRRRLCRISYRAAGRSLPAEYWLAPDQFIGMSQTLYCAGALLEDDSLSLRHFCVLPLQRIKSCVISEKGHNLNFPALNSEAFGLPWHEPRLFRVHFRAGAAADYVAERIWSWRQRIRHLADGSLVLEFLSQSQPEVEAWVRSFGEEVLSMEPVPLPEGNSAANNGPARLI